MGGLFEQLKTLKESCSTTALVASKPEQQDHVATAEINLADIVGKAEDLFKQYAVHYTELESATDEDHRNFSLCCNNIGLIYENKRDYLKQGEFFVKAVEALESIKEKTDEDQRNRGSICSGLGNFYVNQKKTSEGEKYYLKAVEALEAIKERTDKDNRYRANKLNSLGNLYFRQNKILEEEKYYLKVMEALEAIKERTGEDNLYRADRLNILGNLYFRQNKIVEEEKYFLKAMEALEAIKEPTAEEHRRRGVNLICLRNVCNRQNKISEAEKYSLKAIECVSHVNDTVPEDEEKRRKELSGWFYELGGIYLKQYKLDDAKKAFQESAGMIFLLRNVSSEEFKNLAKNYTSIVQLCGCDSLEKDFYNLAAKILNYHILQAGECLKELISLNEKLTKNNFKPYLLTEIPFFISFLLANHTLLPSEDLKKSFIDQAFKDALEKLKRQIEEKNNPENRLENNWLETIQGTTKLKEEIGALQLENARLNKEMTKIRELLPQTSASGSASVITCFNSSNKRILLGMPVKPSCVAWCFNRFSSFFLVVIS